MNKKKTILSIGLGVIGVLGVSLFSGCSNIDAFIINPRLLDPRYKFSQEDLERYNLWIEKTFQNSFQDQSNAIIVDKAAYTLYLIKHGQVDCRYPVDLGFNPFDDKRKEGDGCIPEGMYHLQRKLDIGQTAFHRAFLLNYPNQQDRNSGKAGGAIEIHGAGTGKAKLEGGYNWTLGCIALSNADVDSVFYQMSLNDNITVVKYTDRNFLTD